MPTITIRRDGKVAVFENPDSVPLRYGNSEWRNARWVVSADVLERVRELNPGVEFIDDDRE